MPPSAKTDPHMHGAAWSAGMQMAQWKATVARWQRGPDQGTDTTQR
jgi:hypothetical protein